MRVRQIAVVMLATAAAGIALAATAGVDGPQTAAPPQSLVVAEGLAEDIQADLDARHWTMARTRVVELQKNRVALQRELPAAEIAGYEVSLDSLISQLARQERAPALQSANRLSRAIVGFMAKYNVTVPAQVGYLDVAGRDAIYAAETGRWQDASAAAEELSANYAGVGTHVAGKDSTLDRRVRQRLRQLDRAVAAKSAARVRAIATALLEDVDLVEQTY